MLNQRLRSFVSNIAAIFIAFLFAYTFRFGWLPEDDTFNNINDALVIYYLFFCYLLVFLFYRPTKTPNRRGLFRLFKESFINTILIAAIFSMIVYSTHISDSIPRLFFGYFFSIYFVASFLLASILHLIIRKISSKHKRQTVIFTDREDREHLVKYLLENGRDDFEIIGVVALTSTDHNSSATSSESDIYYQVKISSPKSLIKKSGLISIDPESLKYTFTKTTEDPISFLKKHNIDLAIISVNHLDRNRINKIIDLVGEMGIDSMLTLDSFSTEAFESKLEDFGTLEVVHFAPRIFTDFELIIKRLMDLIFGLIGFLFTLIIGVFIAPLIYFSDPGPIIFKQKRVGKNGRYFNIYKFRSMYQDAESRLKDLKGKNEMNGLMFKMKNDPRITKIGKFIRKTSIDELPQFFNILKGDMSLVGTRPPTVDEYKQYSAHHKRRLSLKPGLTGFWQISGRSNITDFEEIVRLDCYYIDHWSVLFDLKILILTVWTVLIGKGSE